MRAGKLVLPLSLLALAATSIGLVGDVDAKQPIPEPQQFVDVDEPFIDDFHHFEMGMEGVALPDFRLSDMALGGAKAPTVVPHVGSHGSTVVVNDFGVLSLDRDSGALVRSDAQGQVLARMDLNSGAGEIVRDGGSGRIYVTDRRDDRVVVIGGDSATELKVLGGAKLHEPHGLALSPDGKILYVTLVADSQLVALDTETMAERWRLDLANEPRGVAVSADGSTALVGFLTTGALASVELGGSSPNVSYVALDAGQRGSSDGFGGTVPVDPTVQGDAEMQLAAGKLPSVSEVEDIGRRFARNAFAVGFIGDDLGVAPHQFSSPHAASTGFESEGTYGGGGGFLAPITHRLAMLDGEDAFAPRLAFADIGVHQPRAMAYDGNSDTLYVAGYGDDKVLAIAEVSRGTIHLAWTSFVNTAGSCGPDGLAIDGGDLVVHCELSRNLLRIDTTKVDNGFPTPTAGPELAASIRTPAEARGADLFRRGMDHRMSGGGFLACASCHPEGRTDGLSWRIEGHNLQTPLLAGRLVGNHPFKWDGKDKDLTTSLTHTISRLGGAGLQPGELADLQAYCESMPRPEAPKVADADALARGRAIFESDEAACSACHEGELLADGTQHGLETNIGKVDTPSLIGLAHSAPYYHDGSARTLRALLTNKASIHDMGQTSHLSEGEIADLIVYLESL